MSKLVVVSDIHGNAPALQEVVNREGADAVYAVLGDIHGLNAYPQETVSLLQSLDAIVVLAGNHDKAIFHHGVGHVNSQVLSEFELSHTINSLSDEQIDWMQELPFYKELSIDGESLLTTHAKPYPETASGFERGNVGIQKGRVTKYASELSDDHDWVLHGHTHMQYELDAAKFGHDVHFVNPGTLGYNGEYAVVDINSGDVELRSVEFGIEDVVDHVNSVLPENAPLAEEWL